MEDIFSRNMDTLLKVSCTLQLIGIPTDRSLGERALWNPEQQEGKTEKLLSFTACDFFGAALDTILVLQ